MNILTNITVSLTIVFVFLPRFCVLIDLALFLYRDFGILIDLVLYLTEHLGKIDQSLETGLVGL